MAGGNTAKKTVAERPVRIAIQSDIVGNWADVKQSVTAAIAGSSEQSLVLELTAVNRIDSRGIALCVGLFKECRANARAFTIEAGADLYRHFSTIRLTKLIDIREVVRP